VSLISDGKASLPSRGFTALRAPALVPYGTPSLTKPVERDASRATSSSSTVRTSFFVLVLFFFWGRWGGGLEWSRRTEVKRRVGLWVGRCARLAVVRTVSGGYEPCSEVRRHGGCEPCSKVMEVMNPVHMF